MSVETDEHFSEVVDRVRPSSKQTAENLEVMSRRFGTEFATYAAAIFLCLQTGAGADCAPLLSGVQASDFIEYKFFYAARKHPEALDMFSLMLIAYEREQAEYAALITPTRGMSHPLPA